MRSPPAAKKSKVVIFASGSEVEIAIAAKETLDAAGKPTRVVSVPSMEFFESQDKAYKEKLLGTEKIRIAIEAGVRTGWDRFIGTDGNFIGMTGFGASAPRRKTLQALRHHRRGGGKGRENVICSWAKHIR